MLRPLPLLLCAAIGLSGCARVAQSRLNPFNWFGPSVSAPADPSERRPLITTGAAIPTDRRQALALVQELTVDRTPSGAIVTATGLAASQGWFNAELRRAGLEGGTLVLDFVAEAPPGLAQTGTEASRRITAAVELTSAELAAIRTIRVRASGNARESSR